MKNRSSETLEVAVGFKCPPLPASPACQARARPSEVLVPARREQGSSQRWSFGFRPQHPPPTPMPPMVGRTSPTSREVRLSRRPRRRTEPCNNSPANFGADWRTIRSRLPLAWWGGLGSARSSIFGHASLLGTAVEAQASSPPREGAGHRNPSDALAKFVNRNRTDQMLANTGSRRACKGKLTREGPSVPRCGTGTFAQKHHDHRVEASMGSDVGTNSCCCLHCWLRSGRRMRRMPLQVQERSPGGLDHHTNLDQRFSSRCFCQCEEGCTSLCRGLLSQSRGDQG